MTRFDWLRQHERNMEQGNAKALQSDHAYCKMRVTLAESARSRRTWEDRMRRIEKAISLLDQKD